MRMRYRHIAAVVTLASVVGCKTTTTETSRYTIQSGKSDSILDAKVEKLDRDLAEYPKRHDLHYAKAAVFFEKEEYNLAASSLRRALELKPGDSKYHYQLGRVYLRSGETGLAEEEFREAVRLTPERRYTGPHAALGFVLAKQKKFDAALEEFRRCTEIDPENPSFYYFLGSIHDILGNRDETIHYFREYLVRGGMAYRRKVSFILESLGVRVETPGADEELRDGLSETSSNESADRLLGPFTDGPREAP